MCEYFIIKKLVDEVVSRGIDIADSYDDWIKLSFAFASEGENMRELFHAVASVSPKYDNTKNDKQFDYALKNGKNTGIASFIQMVKSYGLDVRQLLADTKTKPLQYNIIKSRPKTEAKPIDNIPSDVVAKMESRFRDNNLYKFMASIFGEREADEVFSKYHVGSAKLFKYEGGLATAFPQIDENGNIRQIKVMPYNPTDGKRLKAHQVCEVWSGKDRRYYPSKPNTNKCRFMGRQIVGDDANLKQTLFGMHLVNNAEKVGIVESEKTALICSITYPMVTWMATGGCNGASWANKDVFKPLIGKRVVLYPDSGKLQEWAEKAQILANSGVIVSVSRTMENESDNLDWGDILIERKKLPNPMTIGELCFMLHSMGCDKNQWQINI